MEQLYEDKLQKEETLRQSLEQQYRQLETLYYEKCQEIRKNKNEIVSSVHRGKKTTTAAQVGAFSTAELGVQTSNAFYYHFEQAKINEYKQEIKELQQLVNGKEK